MMRLPVATHSAVAQQAVNRLVFSKKSIKTASNFTPQKYATGSL